LYEYFRNGILIERLNRINGKIEGLYEQFINDGTLYKTTNYHDGIIDGILKTFGENDVMISEAYYNKGKEKMFKSFFKDGTLRYKYVWEDNKIVYKSPVYVCIGDNILKLVIFL
jgi:antitoxin component YwqK of YwqJK toxin-antitoxin module